MADKPNPFQRKVSDDLLSRFPKAATKTLARIAYRDNPSLWSNLDVCRSYFRNRRGAIGSRNRKYIKDRSHFRKPQITGDPFGRLPKPLSDFEDWDSVKIEGPFVGLKLADLHIPYYDKPALICALEYGKRIGVDLILLNGDIGDHYAESFWETDPRRRDFPQEILDVKAFLGYLRQKFPKARIIYKKGNHEDRHERYMTVKAPELLGVPEFEFASIYGLENFGIELVGDNRPIKLGGLTVIHGHEYRFAISNPVNPARGLFLRAKVNAACDHFHQSSQHSARSLDQKVLSTWSSGCLCDLHPKYRPINDWNHGFMVIQVDKDGAFEVGNLRVVNGKAYY